jgi:hypothetical protein
MLREFDALRNGLTTRIVLRGPVLDRLVHTAHRLTLDGETLRKPTEKSGKRSKLDTDSAEHYPEPAIKPVLVRPPSLRAIPMNSGS